MMKTRTNNNTTTALMQTIIVEIHIVHTATGFMQNILQFLGSYHMQMYGY